MRDQIGVVTGATGGLGSAICRALGAAGMHVVAVGRKAAASDLLAAEIVAAGGHASSAVADVTDAATTRTIVAEVEANLGPIDLLVNAAGVAPPFGPFAASDLDAWWRTIEINLKGPAIWCRAVLPTMTSRGRGRIISLASGAGTVAIPHLSAYVTSKAALIRLTEILAAELRGSGVRVFAIEPGTVRTGMAEEALTSVDGQRWLPWFAEIFAKGRDVPAETSAAFVLDLAGGKGDALSGRLLTLGDDLVALSAIARD